MMAFLLLFPIASPSCEKAKPENPQIFRLCKYKKIIPLILSERTLCAETILNRFLQDHIFDEQRNAAVVAVQKLYFIF